jgi:hypothetical protein
MDGLTAPTDGFALNFRRVGRSDQRLLALAVARSIVLAVAAHGRLRCGLGLLRLAID